MDEPGFAPVAASLREAMIDYYRTSGERLGAAAWHNTLETNSGFVERRAAPLLDLYLRRSGRSSLRGVRVADLGCGFGALSLFFAWHGAVVEGIDPNGERLVVGREVAARHGLRVRLRPGRMQALELPDAAFDLAVANNSLCYVVEPGDRTRALAEMRRILRPGGHLVLRNPNRLSPVDQFTGLPLLHMLPAAGAQRAARLIGRKRSNVRLLTPGGGRRELRRARFEEVTSVSPFDSRWPAALDRFSRYQHLVASRGAGPPSGGR